MSMTFPAWEVETVAPLPDRIRMVDSTLQVTFARKFTIRRLTARFLAAVRLEFGKFPMACRRLISLVKKLSSRNPISLHWDRRAATPTIKACTRDTTTTPFTGPAHQ